MDMMLTDTNVGLDQGAKHDSTDLLGAADAPCKCFEEDGGKVGVLITVPLS